MSSRSSLFLKKSLKLDSSQFRTYIDSDTHHAMGQKFSAWKQSHKEKKAAKEREEAAKRKNAPHQQ